MNMQGAVIAVTGSSRGIGKAIVDVFESAGATVIGSVKETVDVRDSTKVQQWIDGIVQEHGHIDVLVNNAGVSHEWLLLDKIAMKDFQHVIDVNVHGVFHCIHAALPYMKKQNSGWIINIASRAGSRASPYMSGYSASKYAVIGLTKALGKELQELDSHVRCISVSPGGVDTDMRKMLFGEKDSLAQQSPEVIANTLLQILSEQLSVHNGDDIQIVDGEVKIMNSI